MPTISPKVLSDNCLILIVSVSKVGDTRWSWWIHFWEYTTFVWRRVRVSSIWKVCIVREFDPHRSFSHRQYCWRYFTRNLNFEWPFHIIVLTHDSMQSFLHSLRLTYQNVHKIYMKSIDFIIILLHLLPFTLQQLSFGVTPTNYI